MNKYILKNGLIAGFIVGGTLLGSTLFFKDNIENQWQFVLGISSMLLAFGFIFKGVMDYKNQVGLGQISFLKAFQVGVGIAFLASSIYVAIWLVECYTLYPDFMEKYSQMVIAKAQKENLPAEKLQEKIKEMEQMKGWYQNPFGIILLTYVEIFPMGVLISLICAGVFYSKRKMEG